MSTGEEDIDRQAGLLPPQPGSGESMPRPSGFANFMRLPGVKFIIVGIISVMLLVPTLLVWALVEERAQRASEVSAKIAAGWGGEQVINGPYLAVPYTVNRSQTNQNGTIHGCRSPNGRC